MTASQLNVVPKGRLRIYACGGAAINIVSAFEGKRGAEVAGFAVIDPIYIDTSRSNLKPGIAESNYYHIGVLDGSGKERKANAPEIVSHVPTIMQMFKPQDINIVVSSMAGGSGSVIAPSLVAALLAADANVIAIGIGGTDAVLDIDNTMKTIHSYEGVAQTQDEPVILSYFENSSENPRKVVDSAVINSIFMLAALFSRENAELDTRDLYNWLRFNRVVRGARPQLAALSVIEGTNKIPSIGNIFSVATLATSETGTALSETPAYQAVGYMPEAAAIKALENAPIHFITSDGVFPAHNDRFNGILAEYAKNTQARQALSVKAIKVNVDQSIGNGLAF